MMTQPIRMFENLTSETAPAGGNDKTSNVLVDRRMLELRARYARAEFVADGLAEALVWTGRQVKKLVAAVQTNLKQRAAESQLQRMTDRELADIGLSRADIPFVIRGGALGAMPTIDPVTPVAEPANQNLRRVA